MHPNFRINSYDKRRFLINDVAIVVIKTDQVHESANIYLDTQSDLKNYKNLMVTDTVICDKRGLSKFQQCLQSVVKREGFNDQFKGTFSKLYFFNLQFSRRNI